MRTALLLVAAAALCAGSDAKSLKGAEKKLKQRLNAAAPLPQANTLDAGLTVSGISAGGFFASQFHVAFSSQVTGMAMVAGGPFYCAQGQLTFAEISCMDGIEPISVSGLVSYAQVMQDLNAIDGLGNLTSSRVWFFSGYLDTVVKTSTVQAAQAFYTALGVPASNSTFVQLLAEHTQPTLDYGNACTTLGSPYIGNCNYDGAGAQLQWMWPNQLTPPSSAHVEAFSHAALGSKSVREAGSLRAGNGTILNFDQTAFVPLWSTSSGLDSSGYVYIPDACAAPGSGPACKLHVAFHGCNQGASSIGELFVLFGGYLPWAAANNIIVLFPQAVGSLSNPEGCFDWWGYAGSNYALKAGLQSTAVMSMVKSLAGTA